MNNRPQVTLAPLEPDDKEQFILDNQEAFKYGATQEFGMRDDHYAEHLFLRKQMRFPHRGIPEGRRRDVQVRESNAEQQLKVYDQLRTKG